MKKIDYKILCQDVSNPPNEIKKHKKEKKPQWCSVTKGQRPGHLTAKNPHKTIAML